MKNVLIKQSTTIFTGITTTEIDTTDPEYGYYGVPLAIRNSKYPQEFKDLPSSQINFPVVEDEVKLHLGEKIDHKDYIKFMDNSSGVHYALVNALTRTVMEKDPKYVNIKKHENGIVHPPPVAKNQSIEIKVAKLKIVASNLGSENKSFENKNIELHIPIIIPVVNINGSYKVKDIVVKTGTSVNFQLIQYQGLFKNEVKLAAINLKILK